MLARYEAEGARLTCDSEYVAAAVGRFGGRHIGSNDYEVKFSGEVLTFVTTGPRPAAAVGRWYRVFGKKPFVDELRKLLWSTERPGEPWVEALALATEDEGDDQ